MFWIIHCFNVSESTERKKNLRVHVILMHAGEESAELSGL